MAAQTYFKGEWHAGAPAVMSPMSQSFMHGSTVFDGARAFDGLAPDLDRHCARLMRSAEVMGLASPVTAAALCDLAIAGIKRFPAGSALYVRPALFAEDGFLIADPKSTQLVLTVFDAPMPAPTGFGVCLSSYRRPFPDMAPTGAKAACLYPLSSMAIKEAQAKGFDNAIMRDGHGNVVEFASSNLWIGKNGVAITPAPNGTFLNGVTRQRVMALLRDAGVTVEERALGYDQVLGADEVFSTGNFGKVLPVTRVDGHDFQPGPIFAKAHELYFAFARGYRV